MEEKEISIDLIGILHLLKRNLALIIVTAIVFGVFGFVGTKLFITPQYQATSTMIVSNKYGANDNNTINSGDMQAALGLVKTYGIIVKSDKVLDKVINNLQLDETVESLSSKITVTALQDTQVMQINILDPKKEDAYRIMTEITNVAPSIIVESVGAGSCSVLSNAKVTQTPVSPNTKKNVLLSIVLGGIISTMFVIAKEFVNNTVKSEEDITEKLGLPILGVIPKIGDK